MSILHLFFAIIGVLIISIVLAVINLVFHLKITSRLTNLEKEIEKRTFEFDILKKDRVAGHSVIHQDSSDDRSTRVFELPLSQNETPSVEETPVEEGSIQIVRNVGGTFETADTVFHGNEYAETLSKTEDAAAQPEKKPSLSPFFSRASLQQKPPLPACTVIPLFSTVSRGPDFNQLYKSLVDAMNASADQAIAFDFYCIESLSHDEMEYLESICFSLVKQHRSLTFLHCSDTLAALIRHRPQIASLIR